MCKNFNQRLDQQKLKNLYMRDGGVCFLRAAQL